VKASNALGGVLINNLLTAVSTPYLVAAYGVFSQITVFVRSSWIYGAGDSDLRKLPASCCCRSKEESRRGDPAELII